MKDDILEAIVERINHWMFVKEAEIYADKKKGPDFISCTHKIIEKTLIHAKNGGLTIDPRYALSKEQFLRVETWIGDIRHGKGVARVDSDEVPFDEDLLALKREIDSVADVSYKIAIADYFDSMSKSSRSQDPPFRRLSEEKPVQDIQKFSETEVNLEELCSIAKEASDKLFEGVESGENGAGIVDEEVHLEIEDEKRRYANSEGANIRTSSLRAHFYLEVTVRDKEGQEETYSKRICALTPDELLNKKEDVMAAVDDLLKTAEDRINCEALESGIYKILLDPGALATAVHEALAAHLVSGEYVLFNHSTTFGIMKLEKKVMSEDVSVYDDATIPDAWGSFDYDEEGVPAQKTTLIEKGVLKGYLHTRSTAEKLARILPRRRPALYKDGKVYFDGHSNGKSRIGEWDNDFEEDEDVESPMDYGPPEPRTTNLVIESSDLVSKQELVDKLIEACKKDGDKFGIIIEGGTGEVDIDTGEFMFYPDRMIKIYPDGRQEAVSRASVIAKPHTFLGNIRKLGGEYCTHRGWCSSVSGFIPTEARAPWGLVHPVEFKTEEADVSTKRLYEKLTRKSQT